MVNVTADGHRIRVECQAGTFFVELWEARKLAAEIAAAADDLVDQGFAASRSQYARAIADHRAWQLKMEADMKGDPEC